jgi:4-diphosphocytidyl-2-C-methyl-D-erythritol kinase
MHVRRTAAAQVTVYAPAKVNLFLEIVARREDGFHELETLMAPLSLADTLIFTPHNGAEITFECRWACGIAARGKAERMANELPPALDNLAFKAIDLLRRRAKEALGAKVLLVKRIPAAAGLGGASSDAAAALVAANEAWKLGRSRAHLAELAAELGSDVPFFLTDGAAVCRGRGEQITGVRLPRMNMVIVRPPVGLSTALVYKACRPAAKPTTAARLIEALPQGNIAAAAKLLHNRLQAPAAILTDWIARLAVEFGRIDCLGHQMSGSGSSYFGLCRSARHARRQAARLRQRNLGVVFAVTTLVG